MAEYIMKSSPILESDGTPLEVVGELIRCKDCKRWNTIYDRNKAEYGLCQNKSQLEATRFDDYCSRAERKEE